MPEGVRVINRYNAEFVDGGSWLKPVDGYLTSFFGERVNPVTNKEEFHNGLDIACEIGTPAKASADGKVVETGVSATFGKYIRYELGNGFEIFYAHLSEILVTEGQMVKRGDVLAKTGNTGLSTGAHLHLTVYYKEAETDPLLFFEYSPPTY